MSVIASGHDWLRFRVLKHWIVPRRVRLLGRDAWFRVLAYNGRVRNSKVEAASLRQLAGLAGGLEMFRRVWAQLVAVVQCGPDLLA